MNVGHNLAEIKARIAAAAARAGRDPSRVRLLAVSKRQPGSAIAAALAAGHNLFGENYFQEARDKVAALPRAEFHFIGHLQSNKARDACGLFSLIHSVDRLKVARRIGARAVELGIVQAVLVQVNVSREEQKYGIMPEDLFSLLLEIKGIAGIEVRGLMTMPPRVGEAEEARGFFAGLRLLAEQCVDRGGISPAGLELSMGMSHDFEVAVEEGATLVRVGTAIFGSRP